MDLVDELEQEGEQVRVSGEGEPLVYGSPLHLRSVQTGLWLDASEELGYRPSRTQA